MPERKNKLCMTRRKRVSENKFISYAILPLFFIYVTFAPLVLFLAPPSSNRATFLTLPRLLIPIDKNPIYFAAPAAPRQIQIPLVTILGTLRCYLLGSFDVSHPFRLATLHGPATIKLIIGYRIGISSPTIEALPVPKPFMGDCQGNLLRLLLQSDDNNPLRTVRMRTSRFPQQRMKSAEARGAKIERLNA